MCREVAIFGAVIIVSVGLTILGALGPPVATSEEFGWRECELPVQVLGEPFVTRDTCATHGQTVKVGQSPHRSRHVYYLTLPVKRFHRTMSKWYQFLLADLNIDLKHQYVKRMQEMGDTFFAYEVALGYRDNSSTTWTLLARGNGSRLLECSPNNWGILSCDHFPLFELWSVHYDHYIVNLRFHWFPIVPDQININDNSIVEEISLHVIHQHPVFTKRWFFLKTAFFLTSLLSLAYSYKYRKVSLYHKSLATLNGALVLFNAPLEWLSLLVDMPWMTLFNDVRLGLLILILMAFWIILIKHHDLNEGRLMSAWKELSLAVLTAIGFLVYEVCERGIQVLFPFYSLWGSSYGRGLIYISVGVASVAAVVYCLLLVVNFVLVWRKISAKLKNITSPNKTHLLRGLSVHLLLTILVSICSVLGYILPTELFLLQNLHGYGNLSLYGAILLGNYGLWNGYVAAVTILSSLTESGYRVLSTSVER